jgi:transposase
MTKKIELPDKTVLETRYNQYGSTISQLARDFNVSNPVMRSWLKHYNIALKSHKEASTQANNRKKVLVPCKDTLQSLYQTMSLKGLENHYQVGQQTIYEWLDTHDVELKSLSEACSIAKVQRWNEMIPTKEQFVEEYGKTRNLKHLETVFDLSATSIKRLVKEYNIETIKPWRSAAEIQLHLDLLSTTGLDWQHSNRTIINPYELDIVCHDKKLAIEYCGLYWHSESNGSKSRDYHLKKLESCQAKGYDLITIFESDPIAKVLASIKRKVGTVTKVHGRQCAITQLDSKTASKFNNDNHIHGHHGGSVNLGLYHQDELLMVLTMGKSRFNKSIEWECVRMTVRDGYTVNGGASKLFKHFIRSWNPSSIITYADRRFGEGTVYEKCGFKRVENTGANYWYLKPSNTLVIHSRVAFQKHKLKDLPAYDSSMTEWQIMQASGYDRIWDCGNAKYVWYK